MVTLSDDWIGTIAIHHAVIRCVVFQGVLTANYDKILNGQWRLTLAIVPIIFYVFSNAAEFLTMDNPAKFGKSPVEGTNMEEFRCDNHRVLVKQ